MLRAHETPEEREHYGADLLYEMLFLDPDPEPPPTE